MSQKINIWFILARHFRSAVRNAATDRVSWSDVFIFLFVPGITAALVFSSEIVDKANTISLLTSVCAIFAGLLLNLLVLVYDQNKRVSEKLIVLGDAKKGLVRPADNLRELSLSKVDSPEDVPIRRYTQHKRLLGELVVNISYSVIISVFAAVLCMIAYLVSPPKSGVVPDGIWANVVAFDYKNLLFSISVFLTANLVLTLLMIVKRVFKLMDDD